MTSPEMHAPAGPPPVARPPRSRVPLPPDAAHLLIVDDDQRIRDLLARYLNDNGLRTTTARDVVGARANMTGLMFDMIILDVMMPGVSGLDFAREIRTSSDIPILMLTARDASNDRIEGLETGVDDYITKPFEPRELLLRINNVLKRMDVEEAPVEEIKMGARVFHVTRGELRNGPQSVKLTERERELLRLFAGRPGECIPRHELFAGDATSSERAVDVQINRLRRKIEDDPANPVYLQTVRGKGYILHTD